MPGKRRNTWAVERTITALRTGGRLEAVDDATVAVARTLADALDKTDPVEAPAQLASLARAQLAALKLLRGVTDGNVDDGLADLVAALSGPMGDAEES